MSTVKQVCPNQNVRFIENCIQDKIVCYVLLVSSLPKAFPFLSDK